MDLAQTAERAKQWSQAADWWQEAAATAKKIRPDAQADFRSRMEWAKHYDAATKQAAELVAKLKAKEDARTRVLLLHVQTADLDDPGTAGTYLTPDVAETWRSQLPLAVQKSASLSVAACRELGAHAASSFGAGFGGAVWALVNAGEVGDFAQAWQARYRGDFPQAAAHAAFRVCQPGPAAFTMPLNL